MADSEVRQKELMTLELKAMIRRIETFRTPLPDKLRMMQRFYDAVFEAGMRAGEIARPERSDKDYAIEHAEYLAKAVEHYQETKNAFAEFMESADRDRDEETIDQFRSDLSESWRGMNFCIFEFRKRAKRALPAAPEEKK